MLKLTSIVQLLTISVTCVKTQKPKMAKPELVGNNIYSNSCC